MERVSYVLGADARVHFRSVGGDLRLSGEAGELGEIQVPRRGELSVTRNEDNLEIICPSGCLAFVPATAQVLVDHVGGDARITGLEGALGIGTIGGDLSLRRDAAVEVKWVGGDLDVRSLAGPVSVEACGGDARLTQFGGNLTIDQLGGDLLLRDVQGDINVRLGGSAKMRLSGQAAGQVDVQAGGDVACTLPPDADVRLDLRAGGDLRLSGFPESEREAGEPRLQLGEGSGSVRLRTGGDLWVEVGGGDFGRERGDLAGLVASRLESKMAGLEAKLRARADHVPEFDSERIEEQVRRAVSRSLQREYWPEGRKDGRDRPPNWFVPSGAGAEGRRANERLRILRMLEEEKISIEEAELLMDALEGEG